MKKRTLSITRSAAIAALYFILSLIFQPIQFGPVQFRPSEALVMLPLVMPESIIGVAVGCFFSNLASPYGIADALIGTAATLCAALLTRAFRKNAVFAALPPIILNAFAVPLIWIVAGSGEGYFIGVLSVAISEAVAVTIGILLAHLCKTQTHSKTL